MQLDLVGNFGNGPHPPTLDCFEKESYVKNVISQPMNCDETIPKPSSKLDGSHDFLIAEKGLTTSSSFEYMEIEEVPDSQELYEPVRRLEDFAPPKRFRRRHRTAVAGQVLALATAQMVLDADASQR
jgi:hypothetical protein